MRSSSGARTVTTGFSMLQGALFDGSSVWVTDNNAGTLLKLDPAGGVLLTVTLGDGASYPAFDGANIWVPVQNTHSVTVVRASNGAILATLTGNGIAGPRSAAFDGQRVLVANTTSLSLWKAADLTPLGFFDTGTNVYGACSDGVSFWVTFNGIGTLARF